MTGRYTLRASAEVLVKQFRFQGGLVARPRYNIAPAQQIPVIVETTRQLQFMRWGLIPAWHRGEVDSTGAFNVPTNSLLEKPYFKRLLQRQRCMIPADGFYIWQDLGGRKQPYFLSLPDDKPFAFAALWDRWNSTDGSVLDTCTLLTHVTETGLIKRFPIILSERSYLSWSNQRKLTEEKTKEIFRDFSISSLQMHAVSPHMNDPKNDACSCIEPLAK